MFANINTNWLERLSLSASYVLAVLLAFVAINDKYYDSTRVSTSRAGCCLSVRVSEIINASKVSKSTVYRALQELQEKSFIEIYEEHDYKKIFFLDYQVQELFSQKTTNHWQKKRSKKG